VLDAEGISGHATNRCKVASNVESASNNASNVSERIQPAQSRKVREVRGRDSGLRQEVTSAVPGALEGVAQVERETVAKAVKQRWSREAYNAYQRDYMRRYRAQTKQG
jgi:hypothetical protein